MRVYKTVIVYVEYSKMCRAEHSLCWCSYMSHLQLYFRDGDNKGREAHVLLRLKFFRHPWHTSCQDLSPIGDTYYIFSASARAYKLVFFVDATLGSVIAWKMCVRGSGRILFSYCFLSKSWVIGPQIQEFVIMFWFYRRRTLQIHCTSHAVMPFSIYNFLGFFLFRVVSSLPIL